MLFLCMKRTRMFAILEMSISIKFALINFRLKLKSPLLSRIVPKEFVKI